jgi:hypothetical protein
MKNQNNQRWQSLLLAIIATIFLLGAFGSTLAQNKIKYNAVYDCGEGKLKIKVLSCDGNGRDATCKILYINKYAPGGGHTEQQQRSFIDDNYISQCAVEGGNTDAEEQPADNKADERTAVKPDNRTPDTPAGNNKAGAQNSGQFKVGDRVQVSLSGLEDDKYYQPCTIIRGLQHNSYGVGCDPWHGQPYKEYSVLPSWVRAWANASAAPRIPTDKLRVDENDTVLADRELLDCENLKHAGRNGAPPPAELAKNLIRCLYERPSPAGQDGATTMDITGFTIGAPHRWNINEDMGQGSLSTLVYPVHVKWNMKTFYRTRNVLVTDKEGTFTCFADTTNLWQCGSAAGSHQDGKTQEIVVKKE